MQQDQESRKEGFGKQTHSNGDEYEGHRKAGKMHGRGKYRYANYDEYEGEGLTDAWW